MKKRIKPIFVRAKSLTEAQERMPFEGWWQRYKKGWLFSTVFIGDMALRYNG